MKRFFKIANSFSLKLLKWLWNQTVMIRFNQGLIDFCHRHPKLSLTSLRFVARSASNITVVKPSHDQMTKLDLTHHLHMGIIPWAPGHWFILMFILRLRVNLTVDLFLLRNRTCRTFYSVKLGRVLYVASHSTCIMKNSILVFLSIIWVATALLIGTDISDMFYVAILQCTSQYVQTMFQN